MGCSPFCFGGATVIQSVTIRPDFLVFLAYYSCVLQVIRGYESQPLWEPQSRVNKWEEEVLLDVALAEPIGICVCLVFGACTSFMDTQGIC
jgi:hypothetical protein